MATMMGDVTRAIKHLPCVSVAAIDGRHLVHSAPAHVSSLRQYALTKSSAREQSLYSHIHLRVTHRIIRRAFRCCCGWRRRALLRMRPSHNGIFFVYSVSEVFPKHARPMASGFPTIHIQVCSSGARRNSWMGRGGCVGKCKLCPIPTRTCSNLMKFCKIVGRSGALSLLLSRRSLEPTQVCAHESRTVTLPRRTAFTSQRSSQLICSF